MYMAFNHIYMEFNRITIFFYKTNGYVILKWAGRKNMATPNCTSSARNSDGGIWIDERNKRINHRGHRDTEKIQGAGFLY
jgi:hypothetical protein